MGRRALRASMFGLLLGMISLAACASAPAAAEIPAVEAELEVPPKVERAREAVLDFLRLGANECVPPEGTAWAASDGSDTAPDGYAVYRFTAQDCNMAVTSVSDPPADALYHVTLGDGISGLCWQAIVDGTGHVAQTGRAAEEEPTLGHIAATYCDEQGYRYEVQTQENGTDCGVCIFDEGASCNAWAYFRGDCQPGSNGDAGG